MKNNWKKVDVEIEGETLCEEYKRKQETAPGEQENPYLKKLEDIQKVWKERGIGNTNDSTPGDECADEKKVEKFMNTVKKFRMNIKDGDMTMEDDTDKNTPFASYLQKVEGLLEPVGEKDIKMFTQLPRTNHKDFDSIAQEICDLHRKKNNDYGDAAYESYKEFGITSYVIRLGDKYRRLQSLTSPGKEQLVKSESIEDTLKDLAAYAIMAIEAINKK